MDPQEFDVIIAGGGTAGCVVASRLATADPTLRILIVEAGPHTLNNIDHVQPARFIHNILPTSKTAQFVVSNVTDKLGGRAATVPTGHCLGGGSSINFTEYTRPCYSDFDNWAHAFDNTGWDFKSLLPYIKKFETYQITPGLETHGYHGPLKVSHGGLHEMSNLGTDFLGVAEVYDKVREYTEDANSMLTCNQFGRWPKWINKKTGHRSDVPHGYIYNRDMKNVKILVGCCVKRVLLEGTRAVGIEYIYDDTYHPGVNTSEIHRAMAMRMVIVSCGTFNSPLVLERSGIGSKAVLQKNNVDVIVNLSGVGENWQDHIASPSQNVADPEANTLDPVLRLDEAEMKKWLPLWETEGKGLLSNNCLDAGVKYRPTEEELMTIGPNFRKVWEKQFAPFPAKPVFWLGVFALPMDPMSPPGKHYCVINQVLDPSSKGHVHITSKDDPRAAPDFRCGYLDHPADLEILRFSWKRCREFSRRMKCFRSEYPARFPDFPAGSKAAEAMKSTAPTPPNAPDIEYTAEDDKALDKYIKEYLTTTWHALGTCAMKPRDRGGVVDSRLNVYGTQALKVIDMSIAPTNVTSNTYSVALTIAEKAAVMVGEDLGIEVQ